MSGSHLSKDFFELVKAIGESKSKQEEDRIILAEIGVLKKKMTERIPQKKMREYLVRLIYVEMLGHDASFGYIQAVQLTASNDILQKRVGYLTSSQCLDTENELRMMVVNQLQRDMQNSNLLICAAALIAVCKLVTVDMIPALDHIIVGLLKHQEAIIRKKAVMALHRCYQLRPESVSDYSDKLRRALCDKDPSVMGATLHIMYDMASANPAGYKDLVPSFVSILKQITEHRLPRDYDYHRMPAPWIQVKLLKLLAILGEADQAASEGMYEVIHEVMRRADTGINVGYAIIYESVRTVTRIYPNQTLLEAAAAAISRFIASENNNLKYLGVTGLAAIVRDHPQYAAEHQLAVMDCLEDRDETLKRKTLDLLFRMTNPANVRTVVDKLTAFLRDATDAFLRSDLVSRITTLAERYAPSNAWFIQTMTTVFELGGDLVKPEVAHNLLCLIAEGSGEDEEADTELRVNAVTTYLGLLDAGQPLPDLLLQVMAWVLGEYAFVLGAEQLPSVIAKVCALARRNTISHATRCYAVTAMAKLCAQAGAVPDCARELLDSYSTSNRAELRQRCYELAALASSAPGLMQAALPADASCEDVEVDPNLGFLDGFVQQAVADGAAPYSPPNDSDDEDSLLGGTASAASGAAAGGAGGGGVGSGLRFDAYETPAEREAAQLAAAATSGETGVNGLGGDGGDAFGDLNPSAAASSAAASTAAAGLKMSGVRSVWGAAGYSGDINTSAAANRTAAGGSSGGAGNSTGAGSLFSPTSTAGSTASGSGSGSGSGSSSKFSTGLGTRRRGGGDDAREAEAEAEAPRELTEREKMAAALFGGVVPATGSGSGSGSGSGGSSANRGGIRRGGARGSRASSPQKAAEPTPAAPAPAATGGGGDLLDLMGDPSPAPATAPAPAGGNSGGDLLDFMGGSTAAPPAAAAAPAADLLFGGAAPVPAAAAANPLDAALATLNIADPGPSPAPEALAQMSLPPALSAGLGTALGGRSSAGNEPLVNDGSVYVAGYKCWQDGDVAVVLFIANATAAALSPLTLTVAALPGAALTFNASPDVTVSAAGGGASLLTFPSLPPRPATVALVARVQYTGHVTAPRQLTAQVSYGTPGGGSKHMDLSVPLPISDFLRPAAISTAEFGQNWGGHGCESKVTVSPTPVGSLADFMSRAQAVSLHPIEAIAQSGEAIAAGRIAGTPAHVLVHARVAPASSVAVTVHSKDKSFSDTVALALQAALR